MRGIYMNSRIPLGTVESTLGAMVKKRAAKFSHRIVFKERKGDGEYFGLRWTDFYVRIRSLGSSLLAMGVKKGDRIAVYSRNTEEMLLWELAVMSIGAISVPIFSGYYPSQVNYILEHSEAKTIMVPDKGQMEKLLQTDYQKKLKRIVLAQDLKGFQKDARVVAFDALLDAPDTTPFEKAALAVRTHDPCLIMYTSGTTGTPKGVVLTHRNILSQQKALSHIWTVGPGDVFLSYLPWHHSFGGLFERFTAIASGATLCIDDSFGKDIPRLIANWKELSPTHFFSVPKIFQALVTEARLDSDIEMVIFHNRLKFVFTAAAPLPADCSDYFAKKGIPVLEGWGLTETSPCVTLTSPDMDRVPSIVGRPIPGVEVLVTEDREILVRGPNVMSGYFKDDERTDNVLDEYGWFHTGDMGEITPMGLKIICRLDGLFKLNNGEKVSSMLVENTLTATSRFIEQAVAVGMGKEFIGALLFPNMRNLESWAKEQGGDADLNGGFFKDPEVRNLFRREVAAQNDKLGANYLKVKAFSVLPKELTLENGELTPSMKVVRRRVLEQHEDLIKALFQDNGYDTSLEDRIVRLPSGK
jgi:long-subunit acyl-CoA synthetase (AMP-forming)